jgi:E3 ubiquitin-protein ligase ZNF598
VSRLRSLVPNSPGATNSVKLALRSYRASESAARDLILTVWNIIDQNIDGTASIINALVDVLDEEEKKTDLLNAWNGFKIEVSFIDHTFDHES